LEITVDDDQVNTYNVVTDAKESGKAVFAAEDTDTDPTDISPDRRVRLSPQGLETLSRIWTTRCLSINHNIPTAVGDPRSSGRGGCQEAILLQSFMFNRAEHRSISYSKVSDVDIFDMDLLADTDTLPLDRFIPARPQIPEDPDPGDYVVVDVTQFSTTVPELFANGARYVHITEERGDEPAFKQDHPAARIGGGSGPNYRGEPGYDFFNSPSFVQDVDVDGRPTAMTSTNGGNAVTDLRLAGGDDVTVYVGGLTNAVALADHLRDRSAPTYFVAAGSGGKPSPEDITGALYIARYLFEDPPTDRERATYRRMVAFAKGPKYADRPQIKRTDLYEYALNFDSREVVPKLEGQKLYDVSGGE
jgi:2-phosphosulfolactate phosphatase